MQDVRSVQDITEMKEITETMDIVDGMEATAVSCVLMENGGNKYA